MLKLPSGYFVPEQNFGEMFFRDMMKNETPSYGYADVQACLKFMGKTTLRTVIDAGAYVGNWTFHLADYFDTVIAYEPVASNHACLVRNVSSQQLSNVVTQPYALCEFEGPITLHHYKDDSPYAWTIGDNGVSDVEKSEARMIDSLGMRDLDLLKVRTNGSEYRVLQGAVKTLQRCKTTVFLSENFDPTKRATRLLQRIGMRQVWSSPQRNYIFAWRG